MRDMNVWHLLAVHVPNLLPRTVFGLHLPWLRKAARLIYSIILFTIGLLAAGYVIHKPKKSSEPSTWAQVVIGSMFVWFMFALGYGVIPHEWLTFGNSYLNFDSSSYLVHRSQIVNNLPPFDITRDKVVDAVAALIYVIVLGLNIYFFSAWQKRKVAEPATESETTEAEATPITGGGMFSRFRREKRTSAYGRPVTTTDS
jgi:hypothetical protein